MLWQITASFGQWKQGSLKEILAWRKMWLVAVPNATFIIKTVKV